MYSILDSGDAGRTDTFAFYVDFSLSSIFAKKILSEMFMHQVSYYFQFVKL